MSFRLSIFLLLALVAVTAVGATALLTVRLADREFVAAQDKARHSVDATSEAIRRYGVTHASWAGVADPVRGLSRDSQLRIRLVTLDGEVLVDTDNLANRIARPVAATPPAMIDPRPVVDKLAINGILEPELGRFNPKTFVTPRSALVNDLGPISVPVLGVQGTVNTYVAMQRVGAQLAEYRAALRFVGCRNGASPGSGLLLDHRPYVADADVEQHPDCARKASARTSAETAERKRDDAALQACAHAGVEPSVVATCIENTLTQRLTPFSAAPAQLFLGAFDRPRELFSRPALFGALGLTLLVIIATALLARQVSRPVWRLTAASRQLADGDLEVRVPIRGGGELAQLSESFNRMAAAVQASEERQRRLVADVAHELRTPLSNLRGYLEGLQDGVVEPSPELFASLHEETLLQRRILDDLQVLALAEAGRLDYARALVDVAALADAAGTAHAAVAAEAGIRLRVETRGRLHVHADPDRLRQVVSNLLSNAIRYTDSGGLVVVRAYAGDAVVCLSVADTGPGIAPDDLPQVFDRFWRADPARQRATGGTGLGLTIAQRIVHDHGGRIQVSSAPGAGATFTVELPAVPADADVRPGPVSQPPTGA